ncbi:hypothetical protein ACMHYB_17260 [Sorangium sp. So ce1128]
MARRLSALRETWHYARERSRYYAAVLPDVRVDDVRVDERIWDRLRDVPVCTREDVARLHHELRCQRGLPSFVMFTGGSTGLPLVVYGDTRDLEARISGADFPEGRLRPLTLSTDSGHHGTVPQVPGSVGCIQVPLRNRKNYAWAWHLLTAEHAFEGHEPKISCALLPTPAVKKLAYFVLENGLDTSQLALSVVGTLAWHLSKPWRRLIQTVFSATVIDHYGFTETPGAVARECLDCGYYHYGPEVLWEVVDAWSERRIDKGVGKLLVTTLLPFIRDLVLFRYMPGDLVELGPDCVTTGERGLRPVGRINQSFWIPGAGGAREWVLFPSQVQELLDLDPRVGRVNDARFSGITATEDDGFPKWRIHPTEGETTPTIQLDIEMKADPNLFFEEWQSFERSLRTRLVQASPMLGQALAEGRSRLRVKGIAPNGLADRDVFIC